MMRRVVSLWLDIELVCELRVRMLLIGQKVSEFRSAEKIDEHSLAPEPVGNALGLDRVRYVLRELRQRFLWRLGGRNKTEPHRGIQVVESTFRQRRNVRQRLCALFRGHSDRSQCPRLNLSLEIG